MKPIQIEKVQEILETFENKELYFHLETTSGAYAAQDKEKLAVGAYIRNGSIKFTNVKMAGSGPFRVGFKLNDGWMYAEGLTDYQLDDGATGLEVIEQAGLMTLPAIVNTANHDEQIRERVLDAGYPLLYKPLKAPALKRMIKRLT